MKYIIQHSRAHLRYRKGLELSLRFPYIERPHFKCKDGFPERERETERERM